MNSKEAKDATNLIGLKLSMALGKFVKQPKTDQILQEIKLSTQNILAKMEANLCGYEVTEVKTLWDSWTLKEKANWFIKNKVFSFIAKKAKKQVDEINRVNYENAEDDDWEYVKYPDWCVSTPKGIIKVNTKIKLAQPIKFITFEGLNLQLESQNETE